LSALYQRLLDRALRIQPVAIAYRYFTVVQHLDLAAGIAFRLLTYLVPLLGTVLATVGLILRDPEIRARVTEAIISLWPSYFRPSLEAALNTTKDYAGWIGIISIITLFWLGSSLLESLANAFDRVYGVPRRDVIASRGIALGLLIIIPLLFIVTVLVSSVVSAVTDLVAATFAARTERALNAGHLAQIIALATSWLLGFVLALTLFWGLPNVRQGLRDVWPGAALAATLLVAVNQLFPLYVRVALGNQYSALLFLLAVMTTWAFLVANLLLIGVTVNAFFYMRGNAPA
jgi:uncharacterized BrkB/YihY/UPF0761 family membrane protein